MKKKRIILMMLSASFLAVSGTEYFGRLEAASFYIPESREAFVKSGVQATAVKLYNIVVNSDTVTPLQKKEISDFFVKHRDLILGESSIREKLRDQMCNIVMKFDYAEARAAEARAAKTRAAETRAAETRAAETREAEAREAEARAKKAEAREKEAAEAREKEAAGHREAEAHEAKAREAKAREAKAREAEVVGAQAFADAFEVGIAALRSELSDRLMEVENGCAEAPKMNVHVLANYVRMIYSDDSAPQVLKELCHAFNMVILSTFEVKRLTPIIAEPGAEINDCLMSDLAGGDEYAKSVLPQYKALLNSCIEKIHADAQSLTGNAVAPARSVAPGSAPVARSAAPGSASAALVVAPGSAPTALVVAPAPAALAVNPDYAAAVVVLAAANVTPETMSRAHIKMLTQAQRSSMPGPLMSAAAGRR